LIAISSLKELSVIKTPEHGKNTPSASLIDVESENEEAVEERRDADANARKDDEGQIKEGNLSRSNTESDTEPINLMSDKFTRNCKALLLGDGAEEVTWWEVSR